MKLYKITKEGLHNPNTFGKSTLEIGLYLTEKDLKDNGSVCVTKGICDNHRSCKECIIDSNIVSIATFNAK